MRSSFFTMFFTMALMMSVSCVWAEEKVVVKPLKMIETRMNYQDKAFQAEEEKDSFSNMNSELGLKLMMAVEGAAVKNASSYGTLKITEAVDSVGTDLKPKEKKDGFFSNRSNEFHEITDDSAMFFGQGKATAKGFRFEHELGLPARNATHIKLLKGTMEVLAGGKLKTVTIKKPKSALGTKLDDPDLKAAGLEVSVIDPKKQKSVFGSGDKAKSIILEYKGDLLAIKDVEILDQAGESISMGSMWSDNDDVRTKTYDLDKPLSDEVVVKIQVYVGQKKVNVPFELKDVPLP